MGFFNKIGEDAGNLVGFAVGGLVSEVGRAVNSKFLVETGVSIHKVTQATGKTLGEAAQGIAGVVEGVVSKDETKVKEGFGEIGKSVCDTINGIGNGIGYVAENGVNIIDGIHKGDDQLLKDSAKNLGKVALVGALSVGVLDGLDIIGEDGIENNSVGYEDPTTIVHSTDDVKPVSYSEAHLIDRTDGDHFVNPHYVEGYIKEDGTVVEGYWRDGDGNTSINRGIEEGGGYIANNPTHYRG